MVEIVISKYKLLYQLRQQIEKIKNETAEKEANLILKAIKKNDLMGLDKQLYDVILSALEKTYSTTAKFLNEHKLTSNKSYKSNNILDLTYQKDNKTLLQRIQQWCNEAIKKLKNQDPNTSLYLINMILRISNNEITRVRYQVYYMKVFYPITNQYSSNDSDRPPYIPHIPEDIDTFPFDVEIVGGCTCDIDHGGNIDCDDYLGYYPAGEDVPLPQYHLGCSCEAIPIENKELTEEEIKELKHTKIKFHEENGNIIPEIIII